MHDLDRVQSMVKGLEPEVSVAFFEQAREVIRRYGPKCGGDVDWGETIEVMVVIAKACASVSPVLGGAWAAMAESLLLRDMVRAMEVQFDAS